MTTRAAKVQEYKVSTVLNTAHRQEHHFPHLAQRQRLVYLLLKLNFLYIVSTLIQRGNRSSVESKENVKGAVIRMRTS
jgi:hypothetical protein